jgi:hypothetical protein
MGVKPIIVVFLIVQYTSFFIRSALIYDSTIFLNLVHPLDCSAPEKKQGLYLNNSGIRDWCGNCDPGGMISPDNNTCSITHSKNQK